jgi:hypothetical protein
MFSKRQNVNSNRVLFNSNVNVFALQEIDHLMRISLHVDETVMDRYCFMHYTYMVSYQPQGSRKGLV